MHLSTAEQLLRQKNPFWCFRIGFCICICILYLYLHLYFLFVFAFVFCICFCICICILSLYVYVFDGRYVQHAAEYSWARWSRGKVYSGDFVLVSVLYVFLYLSLYLTEEVCSVQLSTFLAVQEKFIPVQSANEFSNLQCVVKLHFQNCPESRSTWPCQKCHHLRHRVGSIVPKLSDRKYNSCLAMSGAFYAILSH